MDNYAKIRKLKFALFILGLSFLGGIYPLTVLWPSGWGWHMDASALYVQILTGVYATLGICLLFAALDPIRHISLIWFTIWSNIVHAMIMVVQVCLNPPQIRYFYIDIPVVLFFALILVLLMPKGQKEERGIK